MEFLFSGVVASNEDKPVYDWFGLQAVCPDGLRTALADAKQRGETLDILLNSPGGDLYAGAEMYSLLRASHVPTRAIVQSLAASAASCVLCGADEALISPMGQVMIHLPSTMTAGNRNDHRDSIRALDVALDAILNAYELKCKPKKTRAELKRMTEATTWMDATAAIECGLCDGLLGEDALSLAPQLAACAGGMSGVPLNLAAMRAAYRQAQHETPPAATAPTPYDTNGNARLLALAEVSL